MTKRNHKALYESTDNTYTLLRKEMLCIGRFDWVIHKKGASRDEAITWRLGGFTGPLTDYEMKLAFRREGEQSE